jgi:hypothetical protein
MIWRATAERELIDTKEHGADSSISVVVGCDTGEEEHENEVLAQHAINGRISYRSRLQCTLKPKEGSPYCKYCRRAIAFFESLKSLDDKSQNGSIWLWTIGIHLAVRANATSSHAKSGWISTQTTTAACNLGLFSPCADVSLRGSLTSSPVLHPVTYQHRSTELCANSAITTCFFLIERYYNDMRLTEMFVLLEVIGLNITQIKLQHPTSLHHKVSSWAQDIQALSSWDTTQFISSDRHPDTHRVLL